MNRTVLNRTLLNTSGVNLSRLNQSGLAPLRGIRYGMEFRDDIRLTEGGRPRFISLGGLSAFRLIAKHPATHPATRRVRLSSLRAVALIRLNNKSVFKFIN